MYFEGSEKKFELISSSASFRQWPQSYWHGLVERSGAKILSHISSDQCDSYLLSESSLFVWDGRVIMLTCGRTTLVRAAVALVEKVGAEQVEFLAYERKNEYFPHQQETDFYNDVAVLKEKIPGSAFRFGYPDEHHLFLFHMNKTYQPPAGDCTLELFMYNLQGQAQEVFNCNQTLERVRQLTKLDRIFPGFQVDDYLFKPCGYSVNALRGAEYYTIHVTPEETGSYVSFETNVRMGSTISETLRSVIEVFQPRSFDIIYFHPDRQLKPLEAAPFVPRNFVRQTLNCGFEVGFASYYLHLTEPSPAVALESAQ